jgi:hypothetical protein
MTAAVQDIKSDKIGTEETPPPQLLSLPVAANVQIFGGTFAANDVNGRAVPCTSAAALALWGRVERQVNNLTSNPPYGAAAAQNVIIRPGPYYFSSDGSVTAAMMGQAVYALDDNTVTTNPTKTGVTYWLPFAGVVIPPSLGDFAFSPTDATKVPVYVGYPNPMGMILHATIAIPLATIQAQTTTVAFNIGPVMPASARLIDAQINVLTALSGGGLSAATMSLSGGTDAVTSIIGATNVFTGAPTPGAAVGTNPYPGRGGQQLKATITSTGAALSAITAGVLSVDVFYSIVP